MNKAIRRVAVLCLLPGGLLVASCGENKNKEEKDPMNHEMHGDHMDHEMPNEKKEASEASKSEPGAAFGKEEVASLYKHYISIKKALVETDMEEAAISAEELLAVTRSSKEWDGLAAAAKKISASSSVEDQRQAFSELTKAIEEPLKAAIVSGSIYKQYCPMAFQGKGDSWFSDSKEIRNPYFGNKMLNCGKVEATIN